MPNKMSERVKYYQNHKTRSLYKNVNLLRNYYKREKSFIRNKDVILITTTLKQQSNRWFQYFRRLLNSNNLENPFQLSEAYYSGAQIKKQQIT